MHKQISGFALLIFVANFSCTNEEVTNRAYEIASLSGQAKVVGEQLAAIGFELDLSKVTIDVQSEETMQKKANSIFNASQKEINVYSPFGPTIALGSEKSGTRLAFYDPNSKALIFREGATELIDGGYLAHELAHIYQDQTFSLENIWSKYHANPSKELFNITRYLVEGHAELVRHAYEQAFAPNAQEKNMSSLELAKIADNECQFCVEDSYLSNLPYTLGTKFLVKLYDEGGWKEAEKIFTNLPASTEQIIHPKKYGQDEPLKVTLPRFENESLPTKVIFDGPMGEAFLLTKLLSLSVDSEVAYESASGWDGDVAQLYRVNDGSEALVWRLVFDRLDDAKQLVNAVSDLPSGKHVTRNGRSVDWIISDNQNLIDALTVFLAKNSFSGEQNNNDKVSTRQQELEFKQDVKFFKNAAFTRKKVFIGPKIINKEQILEQSE